MASIAVSGRARHVTEILVKIEAALQDVFSCYKFNRHEYTLCEKLYFLLSHCSHLMFSLWLVDQESQGAVFGKSFPPATFTAGPDFEGLRYTEYSRRMLHADSIGEHLKNEPKWFTVWIQTLERLDPAGGGCFQEFSRQVLQHVEDQTFPERKTSRRDRRGLEELLREDATGRLLLRSVSVLEDLAQSIIRHLGALDPKTHASEQIAAIICLLGRIRRTIICDTPAKGPYILFSGKTWRMPLSLALLCRGRTRGLLTVVPKRDGSSIVCRYDWASRDEMKSRLWTLKTSALPRPYEETLFATWSYHTGDCMQDWDGPSEWKACWTVQTEEAESLEGISREIDILLRALGDSSDCWNLIEAVGGIVRNSRGRWKPGELSWTYIAQMDRVLKKLKFICREAKVLGGDNAAQQAIVKVWPVSGSLVEGQEPVAAKTANHAPASSG